MLDWVHTSISWSSILQTFSVVLQKVKRTVLLKNWSSLDRTIWLYAGGGFFIVVLPFGCLYSALCVSNGSINPCINPLMSLFVRSVDDRSVTFWFVPIFRALVFCWVLLWAEGFSSAELLFVLLGVKIKLFSIKHLCVLLPFCLVPDMLLKVPQELLLPAAPCRSKCSYQRHSWSSTPSPHWLQNQKRGRSYRRNRQTA